MGSRIKKLNQALKTYDRSLYAKVDDRGVTCVYRRSLKSFSLDPQTHLIIPLTDTWKFNGNPVEWGVEPLMTQIRSMDTWKSEFHDSMFKNRKIEEESKERDQKNQIRDLAGEIRKDFAKETNDIIVHK